MIAKNAPGTPTKQKRPDIFAGDVDDSNRFNFEFKDKVNDSGFPNSKQISHHHEANYSRFGGTTTTSNVVEGKPLTLQKTQNPGEIKATSVTAENPGMYSSVKCDNQKSRNNFSGMSSKEQIEFGDSAERLSHMLGQNKELKELVIMKEYQISQLKADNSRMEKELQNIMDPLSKNSQLKAVNWFYQEI